MNSQSTDDAFQALYDATYRSTLLFIMAKSRSMADTQDMLQETYLEVYTALARQGDAYIRNGAAFVRHIARQKLFRYYREQSRRPPTQPLYDDGEQEPIPEPPELHAAFEELVQDRLLLEQIGVRLREEPPETQKIFFLYYQWDMPLATIAQQLHLNESTVKNRLYRTLNRLRRIYADQAKEESL